MYSDRESQPQGGQPRTKTLPIRLTESEHAQIRALSQAFQAPKSERGGGLRERRGMSDYVRRRALEVPLPAPRGAAGAGVSYELMGAIKSLRQSLSRIGNNLNQITKLGHEKGFLSQGVVLPVVDDLSQRLEFARELEAQLRDAAGMGSSE